MAGGVIDQPGKSNLWIAGGAREIAMITVVAPGRFQIEFADQGQIEIVPEGQRVETAHSGILREPASVTLRLPKDAIEGSAKAFVKIYPSTFSQLVEGLDSIFHMPYGCFEQTSSTTYPNVLALDYLKRTGKSNAKVEEKARHYIHLGYQRLLTFEVSGGGFDWYGRPPANVVLSAYGLMEFRDLARVHDIDGRLVERTRQWLLSRRAQDGSTYRFPATMPGRHSPRADTDQPPLSGVPAWPDRRPSNLVG